VATKGVVSPVFNPYVPACRESALSFYDRPFLSFKCTGMTVANPLASPFFWEVSCLLPFVNSFYWSCAGSPTPLFSQPPWTGPFCRQGVHGQRAQITSCGSIISSPAVFRFSFHAVASRFRASSVPKGKGSRSCFHCALYKSSYIGAVLSNVEVAWFRSPFFRSSHLVVQHVSPPPSCRNVLVFLPGRYSVFNLKR